MKREYNKKPNTTSFKKGHKKIGGIGKGDKMSEFAKSKISQSLLGKKGIESRRWKGDKAGYVAIHAWLKKTNGKASECSNPNCKYVNPKRFEWASISRKWKRDIKDYVELCPSCHRKFDINGLTLKELYAK